MFLKEKHSDLNFNKNMPTENYLFLYIVKKYDGDAN